MSDRLDVRVGDCRDVLATQPYPGAHFATFPEALVAPCIKAGTSERGVCPECGAPWQRVDGARREARGALRRALRRPPARQARAAPGARSMTEARRACEPGNHGPVAAEDADG